MNTSIIPIDTAITAIIEMGLNRLIKQQPQAQQQLIMLQEKVMALQIKELEKALYFIFSQQVDVLSQFEGEPHCTLIVSLSSLKQLKDGSNLTQLIKQNKLDLQGDIELAKQFADLIKHCKPDFEEWLSHYCGDVLAHTTGRAFKGLTRWVEQKVKYSQQNLALAITDEWQIAPSALEVQYFCDQVESLADSCDRVEQRMNQLMEQK